MEFTDLFNAFSKRPTDAATKPKALTQSFRNRVFMRCRDAFYHDSERFWSEVQSNLAYLHGKPRLVARSTTQTEDALNFLNDCSDSHFLDFIEYIFHTKAYFHASGRAHLVKDINAFLRQDDLPYVVTDFVWTKGVERNSYGGEYETTTLTGYPIVIRKDSEALHQTAIVPSLQILNDARFAHANNEFLGALEDYRRGEYGDCLTRCCSAFESVLKVVCAKNNWPHSPNDTAYPLIKTVVDRTGLESFFEQPLTIVATLRNRLSTAHGAGAVARSVSEGRAEFAINATAAAILLVVREAEKP